MKKVLIIAGLVALIAMPALTSFTAAGHWVFLP